MTDSTHALADLIERLEASQKACFDAGLHIAAMDIQSARARLAALRRPIEPVEAVAWRWEDRVFKDEWITTYGDTKPDDPDRTRNLIALYASPPTPQAETRLAIDGDLVQRCRELLEWSATGLLAGGNGGALRALADRLGKTIGHHYALNVAESQTRDEAMRAVVALSTSPAPAEDADAT